MAVADVPVARLALRGREGERATLSERLAIGGRSCHHRIVLLSVGCHDGGDVDGLGHWSFRFDVTSIRARPSSLASLVDSSQTGSPS